jgi:two-component system, NtrC family, nitrogen regulation sensor histidine kinase NtrY
MNTILSIKSWSLRVRIFLSMILITIISSILVASVSIIQFQIESQEYHQERLQRKEKQIKEHIAYILSKTPHPLSTKNIPAIFKDRIFEISDIHNLVINIYDLQGRLIMNSNSPILKGQISAVIPRYILENVKLSKENRFVTLAEREGDKYRYSYSFLMDYVENKPIGILKLPYKEDDTFYKNELENFLSVFGLVYLSMIIVSIYIAYYLSRFITKSLKTISDKLTDTSLTEKNEKIELTSNSYEIDRLVKSYNKMIDELEESANKLAQNEREEAWREMAKQVAHEIKNPLTPMRLTVQSFQRKFDVNDPNVNQKLDDYSKTLIQQIDTMSAVASAFSNFATMPAQQNETINIVDVVKLSLDIFNEEYINFSSDSEEIITKIDRTQLIRIITNLVKNAIQAIPEEQAVKQILIAVKEESNNAVILVSDNGKGIEKEYFERIFEPKFTTKTSGMGLGLAIIKNIIENYHGTITFETQQGKGTTFKVVLPIIKQ